MAERSPNPPQRAVVFAVATFDTKAEELAWVASCLRNAMVEVITVDVSTARPTPASQRPGICQGTGGRISATLGYPTDMNVHPPEIAGFFEYFQLFEGFLNETQSGFTLFRQVDLSLL